MRPQIIAFAIKMNLREQCIKDKIIFRIKSKATIGIRSTFRKKVMVSGMWAQRKNPDENTLMWHDAQTWIIKMFEGGIRIVEGGPRHDSA